MILDELDKAIERSRDGSSIQSYLLGLLEPETASRHMDVYLKTECDFSGVLWVATANRLSTIAAPLVSRFRVLMVRQPGREHLAAIAENVIVDMAKRWGVDRWVLPGVSELDVPFGSVGSVRELHLAVEAATADWARSVQRH